MKNGVKKSTIGVVCCLLFSGCSLLYPDRTHTEQMDKDSDGFFVAGEDFSVVNGDPTKEVGRDKETIQERTPLTSKQEKENLRQEMLMEELKYLEEKLPESEYQHYITYAEKFPTISERIFLLRMEGVAERNEYLASRGIEVERNAISMKEESAIKNQEILVGMSKNAVMQSWGRPIRIDTAGDPSFENERWLFYNSGEPRYIFFERGKVRGWMTKND
ncbi:MAG: hypothetical protein HQK50_03630 [Oligoflexia bacterium]|nr:hypothetical protein [Oligoflexia bacterium]MBF0364634.1 hypothetical protein [Oligoflexia bacterium]